MLFGLDFETIVSTIYHVPISYIIFYYFILSMVSSIIKKVMQIEVDSKADFGIFKIDRNSVPTLLLLAWFGLIYKFVSWFNIFESSVLVSLICVLVFVMLLIFLKEIQQRIQFNALKSSYRKKGEDTLLANQPGRILSYASRTHNEYGSLLVSSLLVLFCLIFSYLEFGYLSTILITGLTIAYLTMVVWEKIHSIRHDLRNW